MRYNPGERIVDPQSGKRGKIVFVSPVNHRIYVEYDRQIPFITYSLDQLGDLFAPIQLET